MEILSIVIVFFFAWYFTSLAKRFVRRQISAAKLFLLIVLEYLLIAVLNFETSLMGLFFVCALICNLLFGYLFLKEKEKQHNPNNTLQIENSSDISEQFKSVQHERTERSKRYQYQQWYSQFAVMLWILGAVAISLSLLIR